MDGLIPLLALLAVLCVLSGPIALIVSLTALSRIRQLQRSLYDLATTVRERPVKPTPVAEREVARPAEPIEPEPVEKTMPQVPTQAPRVPVEPQIPAAVSDVRREPPPVRVESFFQKDREVRETVAPRASVSLEQRIGTRWVLIAGVITVMFAVGFFLKYAYDQHWIGPWGRVLIAGFAGVLALAGGEVTRRRGYDIVAKGVTALGFAILYATVFAAHRWYHLIGAPGAYVLSIGVTAGAMLYAVALDEIVIAMLSLIGGYLTPIILSTGQNLPTSLFTYVLVLNAGAAACAYRRKWAPVNILVFIGTYVLYTGWFERFYRPAMGGAEPPEQLGIALFWLSVFFVVHLALPLLHTLVRRVKSATQDMVLVLVNAAVVLYYAWTILHHDHPAALAWYCVGMGVAHGALAAAVLTRCRQDANLWHTLAAVGLSFITLAVPLYFEVYAIAMLWAIEGLLLIAVGLRYRHIGTQAAGVIVLILTVGDLLLALPLHEEPFTPVFNTAFATWCFVAAAMIVCHVLYRLDNRLDANLRSIASQAFYVAGLGLLMVAVAMELWWHAALNTPPGRSDTFFWEQMVLVFAAFLLLFVARPLCPRGQASRIVGTMLAGAGAVYILATLPKVHEPAFTMFVNGDFARAVLLVAALFASAWLLRRTERREPDGFVAAAIVAFGAAIVLWILLTEEIWLYYDHVHPGSEGRFLARMSIAMLWAAYATALMAVAFWRRIQLLRYLALGILALAVGNLLTALPMHTKSFPPVFNAAFGAWCAVAAAIMVCHVLCRLDKHLDAALRSIIAQSLYAAGLLLLMAAVSMELWHHSDLNPTAAGGPGFHEQMPFVFAVFLLLFAARPLCPPGQVSAALATVIGAIGAIHLILAYPQFYGRIAVFANAAFVRAMAFVAAGFAGAWLLRRGERERKDDFEPSFGVFLAGVVLLWIVMTEEIWSYYHAHQATAQWRFQAQMYISLLWAAYATALMAVGFWRRVRALRYLALGIFVLLLAKIFLIDTRQLETIYRIFGFLVTGLTLVGVSYLYQYLKKTGFFETMRIEKDTRADSEGSGRHA
jgi:uncharacterized membrane protein